MSLTPLCQGMVLKANREFVLESAFGPTALSTFCLTETASGDLVKRKSLFGRVAGVKSLFLVSSQVGLI